jgi:hypothetical protein
MSSYDCVLPVNWARLWEDVIPSWCETLTGRKTFESFCRELIPKGSKFHKLGIRYNHIFTPEGYLEDIGWSPANGELRSKGMMKSKLYKEYFSHTEAYLGIDFLFDAIKQTASEELPGEDLFAQQPADGFYSRLHEEPFVQVAGTKSGFHWMNALFEETGYNSREAYCSYRPNEIVESVLSNLISLLFLAERTLPGVWVFGPPLSWPACDDTSLQGYLAPGEVEKLADRLGRLEILTREQDDELFPLFADRVKRAADAGLGLITMHDGL